ncbi:MAG: hypothetical protein H6877_10245 [Rhodobiaceae bacterium]|nr:hypothetical protein [Rhodobiaceae bacterium]
MARGSKPGERRGGRRPGTPNKASSQREADIKASGLTPLEYMLGVLRDENMTPESRFEAAKAAAPYVHPKLAAVEHTGKDGGPIEVARIERVIVDPGHPDD